MFVFKPGYINNNDSYITKCPKCGCVFGYMSNDLSYDSIELHAYVCCPDCYNIFEHTFNNLFNTKTKDEIIKNMD